MRLRKFIPLMLVLILLGFTVFHYCCENRGQHYYYKKQITGINKDLLHIERRFANRREHLFKKCADWSLNDDEYLPNSWEFVINPKYHLVWCNVFKAASSTWIYNFNLLIGYPHSFLEHTLITPVQLLRRKYPRPTIDELFTALDDSISFLIVRHPFERLLSTYRDKFSEYPKNEFFKETGDKILNATRYANKMKSEWAYITNPPTFKEFVDYIISQWKAGEEPNEHWAPIAQFCTPCQVQFDIIIKFETFQEDEDYLIKVAKLGNIIKPIWVNRAENGDTSDLIKLYYTQLSSQQINGLTEMYKYDLELFQYSPSDSLFNNRRGDIIDSRENNL